MLEDIIKRWKIYSVGVLIFVGLIVWIEFQLNSTEISEMLNEVRVEFNTIQHMPGSEITKYNTTRKTDNAYVYANFMVDAAYNQIKNYYINELNKKGWTFENENIVKEWGKDVGDKALSFTKGSYGLELFYNGVPNSSYVYAISISFLEKN